MIALRRDQRAEGGETRKASTPTGPGRDAIAKPGMVYTVVPPDYYGIAAWSQYSIPCTASTVLKKK
jgi:hypothetical protein